MLSERAWKRITRIGIVVGIIASAFTFLDVVTRKIGFVSPTFRFILNILIQKTPVFIILATGLAVFTLIKLRGRKLAKEEIFIISFLDEGERGLSLLTRAYEQAFPSESRTISECIGIVRGLERKRLVKLSAFTIGANSLRDELFKLTEKGLKAFRKLDTDVKKKGNEIFDELSHQGASIEPESRIESHEEAILILTFLANQLSKAMFVGDIETVYVKQFKSRERADFQILINRMEIEELIEETSIGTTSLLGYHILRKGLAYLEKHRPKFNMMRR